MPILDGPPAFILFGFMMLIAAYVRTLYGALNDLIDKLKPVPALANNAQPVPALRNSPRPPYPYDTTDETQRTQIVRILAKTRPSLTILTYVLFLLILLLSLRILLSALGPLHVAELFRMQLLTIKIWFDLIFSIAIALLILTLWFMHWKAVKSLRPYESKAP